jgi:NADPH:quinone reductase-like Zn-dependent oxidoreductase
VAAISKFGGWASHILSSTDALVPVPADLDPALVETVLVNGLTAWQMLYREARVKAGQTILVHGANGGVGSVLSQIAVHAGIRVIGTASPRHHDALRAIGVEPVDYNAADLAKRIRALAPAGVDAAFDHLGLESVRVSYKLLARGGSIIAYGTAPLLNGGSLLGEFIALLSQLTLWKLLPNSHNASFYNVWAGSVTAPKSFRSRQRSDLAALFALLSAGAINPPIAGRFPLTEVRAAMHLAESRTAQGKVVLTPSSPPSANAS